MKTILILSILYHLCIVMSKAATLGSPLEATWITEYGVAINLVHHADGRLTGTYMNLMSPDGRSEELELIGKAGNGKPSTFGFVVSMKDGSTKVWTGQYQFCKGEATLLARWMTTAVTKSCGNDWKGHLSGMDRFVRKTSQHGSKLGRYIRKEFIKIVSNPKH